MISAPPQSTKRISLSALSAVELDAPHAAFLKAAEVQCGGPPPWRFRKLAELRDLLVLSQLSRRVAILHCDVSAALRVLFALKVTVPCLPDLQGELVIAPAAQVGLTLREESVRLPQPGYSFMQILYPSHVWHPNVAYDGGQLCLGARLSAGIDVKTLTLMAYGALTMTSVQLDVSDPAGVLNHQGALWWLANRAKMPLSREPFIPVRSSTTAA